MAHAHTPEVIAPIDSYAPTGDEIDHFLGYPGARPAGSFLVDGHNVLALPDGYGQFRDVTEAYLSDHGLPGLDQRVAVLGYGANANPNALRKKMTTYGNDVQDVMQTVPNIVASLPGTLAVWHGRPGQVGSVFAELYASDDLQDELRAHVAFLTTEQIAALHISEGATYTAARLPATLGRAGDNLLAEAVSYVALDASLLQHNGKPVLPDSLNQTGHGMSRMSAEQAVEYMLSVAAVDGEEIPSAREYVKQGMAMKLAERKARQAAIQPILTEKDASIPYSFPLDRCQPIGRASLAALMYPRDHNFVQLPEQALSALHPTTEALDAKAKALTQKDPSLTPQKALYKAKDLLDPARRVARRASEELEIRLKND